ncbi:MAG: carboxypeptidase M32 [Spirochaetia bacterium]
MASGGSEKSVLSRVREYDQRMVLLRHSAALLHWDQETYMPAAGEEGRSEQIALLESLAHEELSSPVLGELLQEAGASNHVGIPGDLNESLLRELLRAHKRAALVPTRLIEELARTAGAAQSAWRRAREQAHFGAFLPSLERLISLRREYADAIGWEASPYDALLDEYEPFTSTAEVQGVFAELQPRLTDLTRRIGESGSAVDDDILHRDYPVEAQERFGRQVLKEVGFEFDRGRLDISTHPFSTALGADDVRITTRYNPRFLPSGIFGTVHEAGHALYELGFGASIRAGSLAEGASLGIHESQSRFWENMVGRSLAFWKYFYPELQRCFPAQLGDFSVEKFYRAVNVVRPSLIRVEADEVTYGLHVILRFELEKALIEGDLTVADLPDAWSATSQRLLGIKPSNDAEGVLQDIHWSTGAFGYFPTYALGNLYSACFAEALQRDIGSLDILLEQGNFAVILDWLQRNIHTKGRSLSPQELCVQVTGQHLRADAFLSYLETKYTPIYELF